MLAFRSFLLVSTLLIYLLTFTAVASYGFNWPAVAIEDLQAFNWRTQFDADFVIHLLLFALWIAWREGFNLRGYLFGVVSIVMGGMFSFPYLIHASLAAEGNPSRLLLGVRNNPR